MEVRPVADPKGRVADPVVRQAADPVEGGLRYSSVAPGVALVNLRRKLPPTLDYLQVHYGATVLALMALGVVFAIRHRLEATLYLALPGALLDHARRVLPEAAVQLPEHLAHLGDRSQGFAHQHVERAHALLAHDELVQIRVRGRAQRVDSGAVSSGRTDLVLVEALGALEVAHRDVDVIDSGDRDRHGPPVYSIQKCGLKATSHRNPSALKSSGPGT